MPTERIIVYRYKGVEFMYFDASYIQSNEEFEGFIRQAKARVSTKSPNGSLRSITNVEGIVYDTKTKEIVASWMSFNAPYFKCGAVIGYDGIKRIMIDSIIKISLRNNIQYFRTKEAAEEWLIEN